MQTPAPGPVVAGTRPQECPRPPNSGLSPILHPGAQRERLGMTVPTPRRAPVFGSPFYARRSLQHSIPREAAPQPGLRSRPPDPRPPGGRLGEHRVESQEAQVLGERPPRQRREPGLGPQPGRRGSHGLRAPTPPQVRQKLARGPPDISRPAASRGAVWDRACSAQRAPPHTFPRVPNGPPPLGRRRRLELEAPAQGP